MSMLNFITYKFPYLLLCKIFLTKMLLLIFKCTMDANIWNAEKYHRAPTKRDYITNSV